MRLLFFLLSWTAIPFLFAQELKIGDTCPDIELPLSNYPAARVKLSHFRGKLLILDFWSTNCGTCIRAFPKMESLQKQFGDSIQILLVNRQSRDSTDRFFAKRKKLTKPALPFITGDSLLNRLFPHEAVPFHVWIDAAGVVRYTTDGYNTTEHSIRSFLQGQRVNLKKAVATRIVESLLNERWKEAVVYHSYLSRMVDSLWLMPQAPKPGYEEIYANGASVLELYKAAYSEGNKYNFERPGRIALEVENPFPYTRTKKGDLVTEWEALHAYNYHLLLPADRKSEVYQIMQEDLRRYFNLDVRIEKRAVASLVLSRRDPANRLASKGGVARDNFFMHGPKSTTYDQARDSVRHYVNGPWEKLSLRLGSMIEYKLELPFADETGIKGNVDIRLKGSTIDAMTLEALHQELRPYGLDLQQKPRLVEVLVIREKRVPLP